MACPVGALQSSVISPNPASYRSLQQRTCACWTKPSTTEVKSPWRGVGVGGSSTVPSTGFTPLLPAPPTPSSVFLLKTGKCLRLSLLLTHTSLYRRLHGDLTFSFLREATAFCLKVTLACVTHQPSAAQILGCGMLEALLLKLAARNNTLSALSWC